MPNSKVTASVVFLALTAGACAGNTALVDVKGSCAGVHSAQVCTWAKTSGTTLMETGALVPVASIENAPAMGPMAWPPAAIASIDLPDVARQQSGFTQMTMYWESMGHPPGVYLTPHFDFHFYLIPASDVAAIDCTDVTRPIALPAAFGLPDVPLPPDMAKMIGVPALIGLCVPKMGMHSVLASEIDRKDAFDSTMVIGYYKGKPIFIEPMISKAMLMKKASFDMPIPDVPGLIGPRPTKFRAEYDAAQLAYRFTFSGFVTKS